MGTYERTAEGLRLIRRARPGSPTPVNHREDQGVLDHFSTDVDKAIQQRLRENTSRVNMPHQSDTSTHMRHFDFEAGRFYNRGSSLLGYLWDDSRSSIDPASTEIPDESDSCESFDPSKVAGNETVAHFPYMDNRPRAQRWGEKKFVTAQSILAEQAKIEPPKVFRDPTDPEVIYEELQKLEALANMDLNQVYYVICPWLRPADCMRMNGTDQMCPDKVHFKRIFNDGIPYKGKTNLKLGDCAYLDACHFPKQCGYVHYEKIMPRITYTLAQLVVQYATDEMLYAGNAVNWDIPIHPRVCLLLRSSLFAGLTTILA
jgi:hypothetical protein